jgi:putative MATE family efflux protein
VASGTSSLLARLRERDHTRGSLSASLLVLAIPSIVTSVGAFGVFQLVDLYLVGRLGAPALAAAGATNQTLRQVVFLLALGLSTSSQMLIARRVGEARLGDAEHVAGQTVVAGLALSALAGLLGVVFAEPLVRFVSPDPVVVAFGTSYLRVTSAALFATLFVQLASGILTGAGDATTPMLAGFVVTPVALLGEWALGFGKLGLPELGIAGIALGSALGSLVGGGLLLAVLLGGRSRIHLRVRHLRPDPAGLGPLLRFAWQPALHLLARTAIVFLFMFLAGRLGGKVQAAYTIGLRLELLPIMVAFPVANACATLVGQNLGASDRERAWRAIRVTFVLQALLLWPAALALFLLREPLVALFGSDPTVRALAAEYVVYSSLVLCFYGFYFTAFRALQAAGDMRSPMLISIGLALGLGAPLGWGLATRAELGATGMWIANLVYATANTTLMLWALRRGRSPLRSGTRVRAAGPRPAGS